MELTDSLSRSTALIDFALARSDFLDRFGDVESAICSALDQNGTLPAPKEPFGNRLKAFRDIQKPSIVAKCRTPQRNQIVDGIAKILPIRADMVHSRMHVVSLDGVDVALFINSQFAHDPDAPARILPLGRIKQLSSKLESYAETLKILRKPVNPASSPPPPSPDAADGP